MLAHLIYKRRVPNEVSPKVATELSVKASQDFEDNPRKKLAIRSPKQVPSPSSSVPVVIESSASRLWRILVQNVNRSVDELYYFCEEEGDDDKCKDAHELLLRNARDFENLISQLGLQRQFDNHPNTSVSWEIRKPTRNRRSHAVRA